MSFSAAPNDMTPAGMTPNGMASNGMASNGMASNGMASNGMASSSMASNTMASPAHDFSNLQIQSPAQGPWSMDPTNFDQQAVFPVFQVPEGPQDLHHGVFPGLPGSLDFSSLSGKDVSASAAPITTIKHDFPVIERPFPVDSASEMPEIEEDENEFDLYSPSPSPCSRPAAPVVSVDDDASPSTSGAVEHEQDFSGFEQLCAAMEPVMERIQSMTSHLDRD